MPVEPRSDRQLADIVDRLAGRYERRIGLHRDIVEAAVRSGWAKYDGARVTAYRGILAERAAAATLRQWFDSERVDIPATDRCALSAG
jgi:hypothetical protein